VRVEIDLLPLGDVRQFVYTGDLGLPEARLREAVVERFGSSPASGRAADIARALEELLADHGYLRAKVQLRARDAEAADADIVFDVASGARATVRTVKYRADDPADARDIRSRVPLKTGAVFDRVELRRRLDAAADRWRAQHYYEARADAAVEESETGEAVDVTITFVRGRSSPSRSRTTR